jgi:hypothetical protein
LAIILSWKIILCFPAQSNTEILVVVFFSFYQRLVISIISKLIHASTKWRMLK